MAEEKRIGLFLCNCGGSLDAHLDLKRLKEYSQGLLQVVYVEELRTFCLPEDSQRIASIIKKENLSGVVLAGCPHRNSESIASAIARESNLNQHLITFAPIREHCAWAYPQRETATLKAEKMLASAVARNILLHPLEEEELPAEKSVLIIGGGIGGIQTALELSRMGFGAIILEKKPHLGGLMKGTAAPFDSVTQPLELISSRIETATKDPGIDILTSSELIKLEGEPGRFQAHIKQKGKKKTITAGAIVAAAGYLVSFPKESYGFPLSERVITQSQLSAILADEKKTKALLGGDKGKGKNLIFILGMGGESTPLTTAFALKVSSLIKEKYNWNIFIIYNNIKVAGEGLEALFRQCRSQGIILLRYDESRPGFTVSKEKIDIRLSGLLTSLEKEEEVTLPGHLMVVEERIEPEPDFENLAQLLGINVDPQGFLQKDNPHLFPIATNKAGVFVMGSCHHPMLLPFIMEEAAATALHIAEQLSEGKIRVFKERAMVDKGKCTLCLTCIRLCPHNAIFYDRAAVISEALCQGCGVCASECPAEAIEIRNYTTHQLMAEIGVSRKAS
ncbi:MAG: 4Fe-4S binding protein [Candidatus Aminicenantes bacterium]|nr:4Fe-4S binding protein [Candidatus Aminicenantes bacterium]